MANPQTEDGHVRIANDLWEAIARQNLSGNEFRVLLGILRKLYGFKKKSDWISNRQLAKLVGISYGQAGKMVLRLAERRIITLTYLDEGQRRIIRFNKDFDTWQPLPKKATLAQKSKTPSSKKARDPCSKRRTTKETITKETSTKKIYIRIFETWNSHPQIFPKHQKLTGPMEKAIAARLKDYSCEQICQAIKNYGDSSEGFWVEQREVKKIWGLATFLSRGEGEKIDKFLAGPLTGRRPRLKGTADVPKDLVNEPQPDKAATAFWKAVISDAKVPDRDIEVWLRPAVATAITEDVLTISVPNKLYSEFIKENLIAKLEVMAERKIEVIDGECKAEVRDELAERGSTGTS